MSGPSRSSMQPVIDLCDTDSSASEEYTNDSRGGNGNQENENTICLLSSDEGEDDETWPPPVTRNLSDGAKKILSMMARTGDRSINSRTSHDPDPVQQTSTAEERVYPVHRSGDPVNRNISNCAKEILSTMARSLSESSAVVEATGVRSLTSRMSHSLDPVEQTSTAGARVCPINLSSGEDSDGEKDERDAVGIAPSCRRKSLATRQNPFLGHLASNNEAPATSISFNSKSLTYVRDMAYGNDGEKAESVSCSKVHNDLSMNPSLLSDATDVDMHVESSVTKTVQGADEDSTNEATACNTKSIQSSLLTEVSGLRGKATTGFADEKSADQQSPVFGNVIVIDDSSSNSDQESLSDIVSSDEDKKREATSGSLKQAGSFTANGVASHPNDSLKRPSEVLAEQSLTEVRDVTSRKRCRPKKDTKRPYEYTGHKTISSGKQPVMHQSASTPLKKMQKTLQIQSPRLDQENEITNQMHIVESLSDVTTDPSSGCPTGRFSCFGETDDIIFDFRVEIAPSKIPQAGLGAFLIYLGARKLNVDSQKKATQKMSVRCFHETQTMKPLEALGAHGSGISLRLTGSNLHGNYNCSYWPITKLPIQASVPSWKKKKISVRLTGNNLHYDSDDVNINCFPDRIGYLGMHKESDYVPSPDIEFSSLKHGCGYIDLGRYGPFRNKDRKIKEHFDVKSFIFNSEPSEWCFGVSEQIFGRHEQMIDITDDVTGKVHEIAMASLPMYVNEVGHSKKYAQNTYALEKDYRSVHYFVKIEKPMKKGDAVELLTNYSDAYENVRERKGYGLKNMDEGIKSDEETAARLLRNFEERADIEYMIKALDLMSIFYLIEFVECEIRHPIAEIVEAFILSQKNQSVRSQFPAPTHLQLIALCRINWLAGIFDSRLHELQNSMNYHRPALILAAIGYPSKSILQQCKEWVELMKWRTFNDCMIHCKKDEHETVFSDLIEEICYSLKDRLEMPLDGSMWCTLAQTLTKQLCMLVIDVQFYRRDLDLLHEFYAVATSAAANVRDCICSIGADGLSQLEFDSGVPGGYSVSASMVKSFPKRTTSGYTNKKTISPKGITAILADVQAYLDALVLCDCELPFALRDLELAVDSRFVITILDGVTSASKESSSTTDKVIGIPRSSKYILNGTCRLNETWYLLWQVLYLVHSFADKFLTPGTGYSLEKLCSEVGVDKCLSQNVNDRVMCSGASVRRSTRASSDKPSSFSISEATYSQNALASVTKPYQRRQISSKSVQPRENNKPKPQNLVWTGTPDEPLDGGWPIGWTKKVYERVSGKSKGGRDRYWYSPTHKFKLRSMVEVETFLLNLSMVGGDEQRAWDILKGRCRFVSTS